MKKVFLCCYCLILSLLFSTVVSARNFYSFKSEKKQQQFIHLISQLRCLVCQNESLADSDADLAEQLRQNIYHKIQLGETDEQIKSYLAARYGDFILLKPPLNHLTLILWIFPFLLLVLGFVFLFYSLKNSRS